MSPIPTSTIPRYKVKSWDLSELLPNAGEEVVSAKVAELDEAVAALEAQRTELRPDMDSADFLEILRKYEALVERMDVLGGYASLWFASNTQAPDALSFRNRMQQVLTQLENRVLFFSLWWKGLEEDDAARLLPDAETHEDFRHYLEDLRRFKPHTLDERSEQIINTKNANGIFAVLTLYSMLTNRLEFTLETEGESRTMTDGEMRSLFYSPEASVRSTVYRELHRVYQEESEVLAQIYSSRVRDWYTDFVELRGFDSPISMRNLSNDIPDEAVDTLLEVAQKNAPIFQEYFRLKGGWLGMKKLRRYDIYAPLASSDSKMGWEDAVHRVLETFDRFDGRFAELAERVFSQNHIDSEIRKGKKRGRVLLDGHAAASRPTSCS